MPTITIDGRELEFEPGQTVIQIAHAAGIDIPHYCYHEGLSIAGNCRICNVEVKGWDRPQISCKLQASDGMVIETQSEFAREARAGVMEMLLVNHPLDCPICDQAGECHLQDLSYQLGQGSTRSRTLKTKSLKNVAFGAKVVYDGERCIKCTRCVRFTDEITKTHELSMGFRSDHETVIMTNQGEFSTPYAMNIIDLCPVGALTSKDFRFQSRLWFMDFTPSLCTGCARGCNVVSGSRQGEFLRMEPRYNPRVNQWWMCDAGRLGYKYVNAETRQALPQVRGADGELQDTTWDAAISAAAAALGDAAGGDVLVDGGCTLEEMVLAQRLAGARGGAARFAARTGDDGDDFLIVSEKGANARGAATLGLERATDEAPAAVLIVERNENVPAALRDACGAVVVFATDVGAVPASAKVVFPFGSWAERDGLVMNVDGLVQEMRRCRDVGPPGLQSAVEILEEILMELDATYEPQGRAGLLAYLTAHESLQGVAFPADVHPSPESPADAVGAGS